MKVTEAILEYLLTKKSRVFRKVDAIKMQFERIQDEQTKVRQEVEDARQ